MSVPKNIVLIIATLGAGGAERVMSMLAGEWARRGDRVTLITLAAAGDDHYALPAEVKRVGLDVLRPSNGAVVAVKSNVRRLARLRAAIKAERPDVIISFMDATNVLTLMATASMHVPVIVSERIDPRHYPIAGGWNWLRRKLYPTAAGVVVQTESIADWARGFVPPMKVHVIPNPVVIPKEIHAAAIPWLPDDPFVMAMGRLEKQKGFDLLLRAFAKLPERFGNHKLVIPGEGAERKSLENLTVELKISDRVVMPGRVKDPVPIFARAQAFVLSSRFEGFPNALLEAMALGVPVISFDCPSGPGDIITDETTGLLVGEEDVDGLAAGLARMLENADLRRRLGEAGRKTMSDYCVERIVGEWEKLFRFYG